MSLKSVIHIAFPALLLACANEAPSASNVILNQDLAAAQSQLEASLVEERGPLSFGDRREAANCKSYYELSSKYKMDEGVQNQLVKSEYLVCDALKILSGALKPDAGLQHVGDAGKELLRKLDLRSFPSSLRPKSTQDAHTLFTLYPQQASASTNTAQIETDDFSFTLEVVAAARINDNDEADWVVWLYDESKSGSYRGYGTLVVFDPYSKKNLDAVVYPEEWGLSPK